MVLKFRRGTNAERQTITPVEGEPIYTTDTKALYLGDGSTTGGNVISGGTTEKFELFTLDATDISNKYVEVVGTITDNQSIRVFIDNVGIKAEQGVDYSISGSQIFWTSYDLETLLEVNDKLKIFYI